MVLLLISSSFFVGAGISLVIAGIFAKRIEVTTHAKTSYDQEGAGLLGFLVVAVVYAVFLFIGLAIAQI